MMNWLEYELTKQRYQAIVKDALEYQRLHPTDDVNGRNRSRIAGAAVYLGKLMMDLGTTLQARYGTAALMEVRMDPRLDDCQHASPIKWEGGL
ncbi:MAG TPA: hypothetical protein VMT34_07215 [Aggregatilineales bacterium]|nr:hypothetical protein [Aggregatilineales bacterium]